MISFSVLQSPIGPLALLYSQCDAGGMGDQLRLHLCEFYEMPDRLAVSLSRYYPKLTLPPAMDAPPALARPFEAYFSGDLHALAKIETAPVGTPHERLVWGALRHIPVGQTRSYAQIAIALGGAATGIGINARSVGMANGRNPLALVVPCHRVIGADGKLTGYAGGLERKKWLLAHEGAIKPQGDLFGV